MMALNKNIVILEGRIGKDADVRYSAGGDPICNFSLATSKNWKDKQTGEWQQDTSWHTVVCFKHNAEKVAELGKKGVEVSVTGSIRYRKWQDKNGQDRYSTEILADDVQFPGSRQEGQHATRAQQSQPNQYEQQSGGRAAPSGDPFGDMSDDVPF